MLFQIKCSSLVHCLDVYKIMQSHIINSPEDRNNQDCIIWIDSIEKQLIPIYEINENQFIEMCYKSNNVIEFNNSTMVIVLEFIEDSLESKFNQVDDVFIMNY